MKKLFAIVFVTSFLFIAPSAKALSVGYPTCDTLDSYYNHLETYENLPTPFVGYDALQQFGNFQSYTYHYPYARYRLIDPNGYDIRVEVQYPGVDKTFDPTVLSIDKSATDMRKHSAGEHGIVKRNDIVYYYSGGNLSYIALTVGDIIVEFHIEAVDYPLDAISTPISRLISADEDIASASANEFSEFVDPGSRYRSSVNAMNIARILVAIIVISAPIVITSVVLRHRSRKSTE